MKGKTCYGGDSNPETEPLHVMSLYLEPSFPSSSPDRLVLFILSSVSEFLKDTSHTLWSKVGLHVTYPILFLHST